LKDLKSVVKIVQQIIKGQRISIYIIIDAKN